MKKLFIICMAIIVFYSYDLFCESNDSKNQNPVVNVKEEIEKIDKKINTLIADFEQEIFFKTAELKQKVEGSVVFVKPGNLKLTHIKPQQQTLIITKNKNITIIKDKDKQIIKTSWDKWKNNLEARLKGLLELGNYSKLAEKENTEFYTENSRKIFLIKSKNNVSVLKITFSDDDIIQKAELDMGDTSITTVFKNVKINEKVDELEFKYKNTLNFEVISI